MTRMAGWGSSTMVSIRAPVRGRPRRHHERRHDGQVSIRAPVRGRPARRLLSSVWTAGFDPRPREGATAVKARRRDAISWFRSAPP